MGGEFKIDEPRLFPELPATVAYERRQHRQNGAIWALQSGGQDRREIGPLLRCERAQAQERGHLLDRF